MRKYEAVFIFPSREEEYTSGREAVRNLFKKSNASITKEEDMGERDLAYPIKKEDRGHYYLFEADIEPEVVNELDKSLRLRDEILKFLFVNKEK